VCWLNNFILSYYNTSGWITTTPILLLNTKECGGLFHCLVTTVSGADDSRLAEAANFYVVSFMTGSDQWYERDKLRTWSNGMYSQQVCRQKYNNMRSEMQGKVTRFISRHNTSENPSRETAKNFPSVSLIGLWDHITKHTRCSLKRGEELYQLHSYAACWTATLCRNQMSDLDVIRLLMQPILFSIRVVPPNLRVIRSKNYRGYMKPRIIPNAIYEVILV